MPWVSWEGGMACSGKGLWDAWESEGSFTPNTGSGSSMRRPELKAVFQQPPFPRWLGVKFLPGYQIPVTITVPTHPPFMSSPVLGAAS